MQTFGDLKSQLEMETDTQGEEFIQPEELQGYYNTAVTIVESEIVKLGLREKYLQKEFFISTVQNQTDYAIPTDIVANKIRKVIYRNGPTIYPVKPLKSEDSYETEDVYAQYAPSEYYRYQLYKVAEASVFRITPKASVAVANAFRMIYFGKLNRFTADTVDCDVPDVCYEFMQSYVRYRIYSKEGPNNGNAQNEKQDMQLFLQLMRETLQNQIADPYNDEMDGDFSHYEEQT